MFPKPPLIAPNQAKLRPSLAAIVLPQAIRSGLIPSNIKHANMVPDRAHCQHHRSHHSFTHYRSTNFFQTIQTYCWTRPLWPAPVRELNQLLRGPLDDQILTILIHHTIHLHPRLHIYITMDNRQKKRTTNSYERSVVILLYKLLHRTT
ncbi:hypothetical protein DSUL_50367 [Desulfovibrionales bacterium]